MNTPRRNFLAKIFAGAIAAPAVTSIIAKSASPVAPPVGPGQWRKLMVCVDGKERETDVFVLDRTWKL